MQTVTLNSLYVVGTNVYKAGETVEVTEEVASQLRAKGLVHDGAGPTEQEVLRGLVDEGDLHVASLHGDVDAARRLDALRAARAVPAAASAAPGTPAGSGDGADEDDAEPDDADAAAPVRGRRRR